MDPTGAYRWYNVRDVLKLLRMRRYYFDRSLAGEHGSAALMTRDKLPIAGK